MKPLLKTISILTVSTILFSCATTRVTITGGAPTKYQDKKQPLSLYACNNTSIPYSIEWNKENSLKIPYGLQVKDGKEYFISKYYIASPPLPNRFAANTPLILGVLSEDHFNLEKANQKVDIFMDYKLLKPIQLAFIPVNYTSNNSENSFCIDHDINKIPINIRCPEFNYTKYGKEKTGKSKGLGKGIGQLKRGKNTSGELTDKGQLFIPVEKVNKTTKALENCTVEIVNDILFEHQIYFGTAEKHHEKIDLTLAYKTYKETGESVNLYCKARPEDEPAAGCNPIFDQ